MKNLLLVITLLFGTLGFSQNWKDVGAYGMFGLTNQRHIEILDNGHVYIYFTDSGDIIKIYKWDGQWTNILHPFSGVSSDLTVTSNADTIYFGFFTAGMYEVHKYDESTFSQQGTLTLTDYLQGGTDLSVEPASGNLLFSHRLIDNDIGSSTNVHVNIFDGSSWSQYGNNFFLEYPQVELVEGEIMSNGAFTYFLSSEFDMNGASVKPGGTGEMVANRAFGAADARFYLIDNLAPSTWSAYDLGNYIINDPNEIELTANENNPPILGLVSDESNTDAQVFRPIGGSAFAAEPVYSALGQIMDFDLEAANNDSAYFVYCESPQGPYTSHVMYEDNGMWMELGAPGPVMGDIDAVDIELTAATNKTYFLYQDNSGATGLRVFNTAPVAAGISTLYPACQNVADQLLYDDIYITDADNDSIWMFGISLNQATVTDANITLTRSNAYNPLSQDNNFSLSITPENGASGTVDIEMYATDGVDTTLAYTETVEIFLPPTASITAMPTDYCNNAVIDVLDQYGSPAGGTFMGQGVYNNILDPQLLTPDGYGVNYIYQDNNGCLDTANHVFGIWEIPTIALSITNAGCSVLDGEVDATVSNGTSPYDIYWSNGSSTEDISGLGPNMYYMNVTDDNGCYVMAAANVTTTGFDVTGNVTNLQCDGDLNGSIDITATGTGPFTFQWSNGESTEDISGLEEGQYEVFVTDGTGCESMVPFNVTAPDPINATFDKIPGTCGMFDGNLAVNETGGAGGNNYAWTDYLGAPVGTNSQLIGGISGGEYWVEITDMNGCTATFGTSLSETGGPTIVVSSVTDASCSDDGAIDITILSNSGIASIDWTNGATTEDISGLSADIYMVNVVDNFGCLGMADIIVNPIVPATDEICVVTVDSTTNTNLIVWEKPVSTEISHFNVYRESSVAGVFMLVDSVLYSEESEYNDTIAYPHLRSWRYKLTTVNNCGVESYNGLIHKTIHLVINPGLPGFYNLTWDQYEGFGYPTYFIWRHQEGTGWEEIDQVAFGTESYTNEPPSEDGLDYRIVIQPPNTCTSTQAKATDYNSSRSNKADGATLSDPDDDTGISSNDIGLTLYPNPTNGEFYLITKGLGSYQLTVFDLSGKMVITKKVNTDVHLMDVEHLSSGSYLIQIRTENGIANEQLIVR